MSRFYTILTVLALGSAASACGRGAGLQTGSVQPVAGAVTVRVVNNNFNDVDVYSLSTGIAQRLGTVTAGSKETFVMTPSDFPNGQIRLVATPIGGGGRGFSGPLNVMPGQSVEFDIAPNLRDSAAFIH